MQIDTVSPDILQRASDAGQYIKKHRCTIRDVAQEFGVSKSLIHIDLTERLILIDPELAEEVHEILQENYKERHIRGGHSTKKKYSRFKKK